jgi:phosphohistidine phosphatase
MRRLMLLRHAKTERPEAGQRDRDRKLTKRGRADAPLIGAYMARHGLIPDVALVSPATRAQETWELVAPAFVTPPRLVTEGRIYNASAEALIELIGETRGAHSLVVVGHNPGLQDVAVRLMVSGDVEARERVSEKLPTAGLVVIDLAFDDWSRLPRHAGRLERFVTPRLIAASTD